MMVRADSFLELSLISCKCLKLSKEGHTLDISFEECDT
jgi:hypothetical protein